jgi:hypothetical protein
MRSQPHLPRPSVARSPARTRRRADRRLPVGARLIFPALLLLALVASAPAPSAVAAQGAGFGVRFTGLLRLSGEFAPPGTAITVYQGDAYRDVQACGTGTVSGRGQWQVDVPPVEGCGETDTSPCCRFTFVAHNLPGQPGVRELVGACSCGRFELDRPQTWGRTVQLNGSAVRLPGSPSDSSDPLPAVWFYGIARLGGRPAPVGTQVHAQQGRQGVVHECGMGTVTTEEGAYALAVPAVPGCAEDEGVPCCAFTFFIEGENVGGCSCGVARFRTFNSFGRQVRLDLSGRSAARPVASPMPASRCPLPRTASAAGAPPAGTYWHAPLRARVAQATAVFHTQDVYLIAQIQVSDADGAVRDVTRPVLDHAATSLESGLALRGGLTLRRTGALRGRARDESGGVLSNIQVDVGLLSRDDTPDSDMLVVIASADVTRTIRNLDQGDALELDLNVVPGLEAAGDGGIAFLFLQTLMPTDVTDELGLSPLDVFVRRWDQGRLQAAGIEQDGALQPLLALGALTARPLDTASGLRYRSTQPYGDSSYAWATKLATQLLLPVAGAGFGTLAGVAVGLGVAAEPAYILGRLGQVGAAQLTLGLGAAIGGTLGAVYGWGLGVQKSLEVASANSTRELAAACG